MRWPFSAPRPTPPSLDDPHWERSLLHQLAADVLREQRRSRRWNYAFKFALLGYAIIVLLIVYAQDVNENLQPATKHTAIVEINGVIAPDSDANADRIIGALRRAFESDTAQGVILRINSPGGSPVQSGYINDEIQRLRKKYPNKPVYAVTADICASGAYYIAVAADAIYVNKASLIGSIGVRMDSFGLEKALESLGIERRLLTAGEHKGILDPFLPLDPEEETFIHTQLDALHQQFIAAVKSGRGQRLKGADNVLFSGLFWNGAESIQLGLADAIGSSSFVAREVIKAEELVTYTKKQDLLERFADRLGASIAAHLTQSIGWHNGVALPR